MEDKIVLSPLRHTWIIDLDGTVVKHNGYKIDGYDTFLDGAVEFLETIPDYDMIIFLTSRKENLQTETEEFLRENNIRYDHIIYNAPYGERILINDDKPSGLKMGISLNKVRNSNMEYEIEIDDTL